MRWRTGRRSQNVEDRRGTGSAGMGGMRFPVGVRLPGGGGRGGGARGAGIGGGIGLIVLVLAALFLGVDPGILFDEEPGGAPTSAVTAPPRSGADGELADFVSVVLGDTEDTWRDLFQGMGRTYREPTLVLFSDAAESACGLGQAAMGPFYCPGDERVYIDLAFFEELESRFGAPGDFAQAYVIAHEVGHHVQNLLGISEQVHAARLSSDPAEANDLSVRLELQADCFAGVWARHAHESRQVLEEGDVEEALGAASAVGDDRLQRQARGYVVPESFTHGSAAQRARWFNQGIQGGDLAACDTFNANEP